MKKEKTAITPTRIEDYPEWYQQVVKAADLAENSSVRGCMVIRPWGYGIWEKIQADLDRRIKETGCDNAYFPLFIPLSFFEKEAKHVEGFAKECAVVTHHRLEEHEGRLVPTGKLEEPLIVRPTSETIIGDSFSRWVQSYRDLPLRINQWANVVRWEMRTRLFLRTTEFLWQEGHTVHATKEEAVEETMRMLEVYRSFMEDMLALPVIVGEKSPGERFPGAENTFCLEAMMQDRKALQAGTSHYLGQNFAKGSDIKFCDQNGQVQYGYTTSWGTTTRMIGAVIMCHSDDDGLRLPPRIAPKQVVLLPIIPKPECEAEVLAACEKAAQSLRPVSSIVDKRDMRGGEKSWDWIKKGIPIRIEIGPKDLEQQAATVYRRDRPHKERLQIPLAELPTKIPELLEEIQKNLFEEAKAFRDAHLYTTIRTFEELTAFFTPKNGEKPEIHGGFVLAKWCGDPKSEALQEPLKASIRCLPLKQTGTEGVCILTGQPATLDVIIAKSY